MSLYMSGCKIIQVKKVHLGTHPPCGIRHPPPPPSPLTLKSGRTKPVLLAEAATLETSSTTSHSICHWWWQELRRERREWEESPRDGRIMGETLPLSLPLCGCTVLRKKLYSDDDGSVGTAGRSSPCHLPVSSLDGCGGRRRPPNKSSRS